MFAFMRAFLKRLVKKESTRLANGEAFSSENRARKR